jgi:hypothetical protein
VDLRRRKTVATGVAMVLAAISIGACDDSTRVKPSTPPFAVIFIANANASEIVIHGCKICGGDVRLPGSSNGFGPDGNEWQVFEPAPLTFSVQITGGRSVNCRPTRPIAAQLPQTKTYHVDYRITPDGRCVVTRQTIT